MAKATFLNTTTLKIIEATDSRTPMEFVQAASILCCSAWLSTRYIQNMESSKKKYRWSQKCKIQKVL